MRITDKIANGTRVLLDCVDGSAAFESEKENTVVDPETKEWQTWSTRTRRRRHTRVTTRTRRPHLIFWSQMAAKVIRELTAVVVPGSRAQFWRQ